MKRIQNKTRRDFFLFFFFNIYYIYLKPDDRARPGLSYQIVHLQNTRHTLRCKRAVWHATRNTEGGKKEEEEAEG